MHKGADAVRVWAEDMAEREGGTESDGHSEPD
jgi:hypothetical protein